MSDRHMSKYSGQQVGKWLDKKNLAFSHDSVSAHCLGKRTGGGFLSVSFLSRLQMERREEARRQTPCRSQRQVAEPRLLGWAPYRGRTQVIGLSVYASPPRLTGQADQGCANGQVYEQSPVLRHSLDDVGDDYLSWDVELEGIGEEDANRVHQLD